MTKPTARTQASRALIGVALVALVGCSTASPEATTSVAPSTTPSPTVTVTPTPSPSVTPSATPSTTKASPSASKQSDALDAMVAASQEQIAGLKELFGTIFSDVRISGENGDTLVYEFQYAEQVDAKATIPQLKASAVSIQPTADDQLFPAMKAAGVPTPKLRYSYFNADGTELWSKTFSPS